MRTVQQWFDEYSESHSNPKNEVLHFLCVPFIVMTVIGFLWAIPMPAGIAALSPWLNLGTLGVVLAIAYYFFLAPRLGLGATVVLVAMLFVVRWLDTLAWPLWLTCALIFVVGWIGQFIGHAYEGKRPSFTKDIEFLMIGPIWLLGHLYRRLGIAY